MRCHGGEARRGRQRSGGSGGVDCFHPRRISIISSSSLWLRLEHLTLDEETYNCLASCVYLPSMVEEAEEVPEGLIVSIRKHQHVSLVEAGGHHGEVRPQEQEAGDLPLDAPSPGPVHCSPATMEKLTRPAAALVCSMYVVSYCL